MNWKKTLCVLAVGCTLVGCATDQPNQHVLKLDQTYNRVIVNAHGWALEQFSGGPISGTNVSDYARIVLAHGLNQGRGDFGADGTQELFLREDCPARVWEVLVFKPTAGGYRYLGHFPAGLIVLSADQPTIQVYEPCGGHYGYIKTYRHDGKKFVCASAQGISVGDGAPEENNRRMAAVFPEGKVLKWAKAPNRFAGD
jgi:hypothetical protein